MTNENDINISVSNEFIRSILIQKIAGANGKSAIEIADMFMGFMKAENRVRDLAEMLTGGEPQPKFPVGSIVKHDTHGVVEVTDFNKFQSWSKYTVTYMVDGEPKTDPCSDYQLTELTPNQTPADKYDWKLGQPIVVTKKIYDWDTTGDEPKRIRPVIGKCDIRRIFTDGLEVNFRRTKKDGSMGMGTAKINWSHINMEETFS